MPHKLEALEDRSSTALPVVLVSLLGVSTGEFLPAPLALVYRPVLRVRALVMTVSIVHAGKCAAAFIA